MLVLSRKCGEKIVIPHQNITLTVLEIRGDRVRLGITAPPDVPVHRQESWQRIRDNEPPVEADELTTLRPISYKPEAHPNPSVRPGRALLEQGEDAFPLPPLARTA